MHAIYGHIELENGLTLRWLDFISEEFTFEAAKAEAVRIQSAIWKNCFVRCWTD